MSSVDSSAAGNSAIDAAVIPIPPPHPDADASAAAPDTASSDLPSASASSSSSSDLLHVHLTSPSVPYHSVYTGTIHSVTHQRHGFGKQFFSNGSIFEGEWAYDRPIKGEFIDSNGRTMHGMVDNGDSNDQLIDSNTNNNNNNNNNISNISSNVHSHHHKTVRRIRGSSTVTDSHSPSDSMSTIREEKLPETPRRTIRITGSRGKTRTGSEHHGEEKSGHSHSDTKEDLHTQTETQSTDDFMASYHRIAQFLHSDWDSNKHRYTTPNTARSNTNENDSLGQTQSDLSPSDESNTALNPSPLPPDPTVHFWRYVNSTIQKSIRSVVITRRHNSSLDAEKRSGRSPDSTAKLNSTGSPIGPNSPDPQVSAAVLSRLSTRLSAPSISIGPKSQVFPPFSNPIPNTPSHNRSANSPLHASLSGHPSYNPISFTDRELADYRLQSKQEHWKPGPGTYNPPSIDRSGKKILNIPSYYSAAHRRPQTAANITSTSPSATASASSIFTSTNNYTPRFPGNTHPMSLSSNSNPFQRQNTNSNDQFAQFLLSLKRESHPFGSIYTSSQASKSIPGPKYDLPSIFSSNSIYGSGRKGVSFDGGRKYKIPPRNKLYVEDQRLKWQ